MAFPFRVLGIHHLAGIDKKLRNVASTTRAVGPAAPACAARSHAKLLAIMFAAALEARYLPQAAQLYAKWKNGSAAHLERRKAAPRAKSEL
jgi:hypothetical protein